VHSVLFILDGRAAGCLLPDRAAPEFCIAQLGPVDGVSLPEEELAPGSQTLAACSIFRRPPCPARRADDCAAESQACIPEDAIKPLGLTRQIGVWRGRPVLQPVPPLGILTTARASHIELCTGHSRH